MTAKQMESALRRAAESDPRSARQLAIDAGMPQPTLSRFLAKERSISWRNAAKLLSALGFRLDRD
jgi:DNA-binding phage protein